MNTKKLLFWLLIIVFVIVLAYNYILAPAFIQQNVNTGMGMHMGMNARIYTYNTYNQYTQIIVLLIIISMLLAAIFLYSSFLRRNGNKCSRCGKTIEDNRWNICPVCGTRLKRK